MREAFVGRSEEWLGGTGFLFGVMEMFLNVLTDGFTTMTILKNVELYSLNGWTVCSVNYISIKLLEKCCVLIQFSSLNSTCLLSSNWKYTSGTQFSPVPPVVNSTCCNSVLQCCLLVVHGLLGYLYLEESCPGDIK